MQKIERSTKHDRYVETLCAELEPRYDLVLTHVPLFSTKRRLIAEIDILAFNEGHCDIYEVKCSPRIAKARRQLLKIKKHVSKNSDVQSLFFFCGESGKLTSL